MHDILFSHSLRDFLFGKYKSNSKERYLKRKEKKLLNNNIGAAATTTDQNKAAVAGAATTDQNQVAVAVAQQQDTTKAEPPCEMRASPTEDRDRRDGQHYSWQSGARLDAMATVPFTGNRDNNDGVGRRHADPQFWQHRSGDDRGMRMTMMSIMPSPIQNRRLPPSPAPFNVTSPPPPAPQNPVPAFPPPPPCYAAATTTATTPCRRAAAAQDILASIYNGQLPLINLPVLLQQQTAMQKSLAQRKANKASPAAATAAANSPASAVAAKSPAAAAAATNSPAAAAVANFSAVSNSPAAATASLQQPNKRTDSPSTVTAEDESQSSATDELEEESDVDPADAAAVLFDNPRHRRACTTSSMKCHPRRDSFDTALAQAMDAVLAPADNDALRDFSEQRLIDFAGVLVRAAQQYQNSNINLVVDSNNINRSGGGAS